MPEYEEGGLPKGGDDEGEYEGVNAGVIVGGDDEG